jgi:hypothetical protein
MKKTWLLILPLGLLITGCSFTKTKTPEVVDYQVMEQSNNNVCSVAGISTTSEVDIKTVLPPVSQEEKNKTFTYEDEELGVKMKYPGSCYFNKGVFQCSDFTLSIWLLEPDAKVSQMVEKRYVDSETELKYTYSHNGQVYALMAWYNGADNKDLDAVIDKIAKSISFTR